MIVKGTVKRLGEGTWGNQGTASWTRYSLVQIGDTSIRTLLVTEYLNNFLEVGAEVEALILRLYGTKAILALKRDGQVHRDRHWGLTIVTILLFIPPIAALLFGVFPVALVLAILPLILARQVYAVLTFR